MKCRTVLMSAVLLLAGFQLLAQDYEIRMSRESKVGEKYELTGTGSTSEDSTITGQGQVLQKQSSFLEAKLEATVTVLAVDSLKRESKVSLVVSRCQAMTNLKADTQDLLPKGTVVVAQLMANGKPEFQVDGKVVAKDVAKALGLFISLPTGKSTDDDMFGTQERKKIGDSWSVNSAKAAADLAEKEIKVSADNVKGQTTVEKLVETDGVKCLRLSCSMEASNVPVPLPPELKIEKATLSGTFSGDFPLDLARNRQAESAEITMSVLAKGRPAPEAPALTLLLKNKQIKKLQRKDLN